MASQISHHAYAHAHNHAHARAPVVAQLANLAASFAGIECGRTPASLFPGSLNPFPVLEGSRVLRTGRIFDFARLPSFG
jgi:hypothetical protein